MVVLPIVSMSCLFSALVCVLLGSMYVGSLYVWHQPFGRDHPSTIKKRFISVFFMTIISAVFVYCCTDTRYFHGDVSYWSLMGLRWKGFTSAAVVPLLLTMVLFSGPLFLQYLDGFYHHVFDLQLWKFCVNNVVWLRNHVIAPFTEEFTFRACMLPILVPCFGSFLSVFICPFFFGIAHLHHLKEKLSLGVNIQAAILQSLFQFAYTTVFGAYSTYLFLRTGHFVAPLVAHAFCNHMGFPDFGQLWNYDIPARSALMLIFVAGLVCWMLLLEPLTDPVMYSNNIYW